MKANTQPIILATDDASVTFEPQGDKVTVTRKSRKGPWDLSNHKRILGIEKARKLYARLLEQGFEPW